MQLPKFCVGSLVTYKDEIHEVKNFKPSPGGYLYTLEIRAFLRDMNQVEWENQLNFFQVEANEHDLLEFSYKKPKFMFGERLKLNDNKCVVKFIKFENYVYKYDVMAESYWGGVNYGWKAEEDYLRR